ncbi:beta-propeller domain-containing protein [Nocardioides sp. SOB77]|uniref:Beta-propeller domain-containing protein n=1 Tax=Nocardioides oceani TaxID=3058369 RepID=A0ABT8FHJ5_9ACTN|nr:beta-propeller domain-containing protein [Nocardioides oceani]MDN4173995.1 beta-propeller domain-containing protein [Nocardioides oceani]
MTDLERLWDDVPVGPAPTDRILRAARREQRGSRRRPLLRSAGTVVALGALAAAFVAGTQVSGGPQDPGPGTPGADDRGSVAEFSGALVAAGSCEVLLEHYVDAGQALVGPWGWDTYPVLTRLTRDFAGVARAASPLPAVSAKVTRATSSDTGTNVQEAGVDEPDLVKTDGEVLYRLSRGLLTSYDVTGPEVERIASVALPGMTEAEILLAGDTVVAVAPSRVLTVDVADPAAMQAGTRVDLTSPVVSARQHGDDLRLVVSTGLPELDFVRPDRRRGVTAAEAERRNRAIVADTTVADWLPRASVDRGPEEQLSDCADVAVPSTTAPLGTTTVLGFAANDVAAWDVTAVAADASTTYSSTDHLYLATSGAGTDPWAWGCATCTSRRMVLPAGDGTTQVFDFALDGIGTRYAGAGRVDGALRDRWAMDEVDGVLRLALSPTSETGPGNAVVTLRREGEELLEVGRLDGIAPREDITAVRWFDDLAVLVTFRQVDPLHTIDLSDPARPRVLGELKIPGFSSYLHPLGERRMLGIGQGLVPGPRGSRGWGAQAGLFDVTDLTAVRRRDTVDYAPGSYAGASADPRQLTWLPGRRTVVTVVSRGRTGYVSVLRLADGRMTNEMVLAERGSDVDAVRLVPLADERVVLVTDDDASNLDLDGPAGTG